MTSYAEKVLSGEIKEIKGTALIGTGRAVHRARLSIDIKTGKRVALNVYCPAAQGRGRRSPYVHGFAPEGKLKITCKWCK